MNFNELTNAAKANRDAFKAAFNAWLKSDDRSAACPSYGPATFGNVSILASDGSANGRSANKYRMNYKLNGKRCTEAEAKAALAG